MGSTRMEIPPTSSAALIFVHGGWPTRIAMRLGAHGLRGDSVEAAMALNPTCDVHNFAQWYATPSAARAGTPPALKFDFSSPTSLQKINIASGDEIQYVQGGPLSRACVREVASDTLGIIDIAPHEWQSDLPGLGGEGAMVVRDLGPEENSRLIAQYPERKPMMLLRTVKEGPPALVPYADGIKVLWRAE